MAVRRRDRRRFGVCGAAVALAGTLAVIGPAAAQDIVKDAKASLADLPTWKIPEICAKDSAQSHCLALESRAWRTVSGSWVSLPDAVKTACLGATRSPLDRSWRVLGDCVDEEMEKAGDKHAVLTAHTPAELVPPPKPAVIAAAVPPPVLGVTIAPPPFALDAEADAKRKVEAEAKRAAEEAAARKEAEVAAAKKAAEDAEAKRKADADARRLADEATAKKAAEDAEAKRVADAAAAKRVAEAEALAKACQDKLQAVAQGNAVRFRVSSASIDRESNPALDRLADVVKACPGNQIRVEGHTDSIGDPGFNLTLSRNRAQAIVDYLVKAGVDASLVAAEGFGDTKPIAGNETPDGRAQNRRIEFKVQAK